MAKLDTATIKAALVECHGLAYAAARHLGLAPSTVFRRIQRHPELAELVKDARELRIDEAEGQLQAAIKRGEAWAICFFLKTQGRSRGYSERLEVAPMAVRREIVEEIVTVTPALLG